MRVSLPVRAGAVLITALIVHCPSYAEGWPTKPIRIISGYPPATASDNTARLIAAELQDLLKKPIIVENKPGAQGVIAAGYVAKASPDGYTLLMSSANIVAQNPSLFKKLPYDSIKDFVFIGRVATFPIAFMVTKDSPVKNLVGLAAISQTKGRPVSYGFGNGTSQIVGAALGNALKMNALAVPYKSSAQGLTDLIGSQIDFMVSDIAGARPFIDGKQVRLLAISTRARSSLAPGVPTVAEETGMNDFDIATWVALAAPAGTRPEIVGKLNDALTTVLARKDVAKKMAILGGELAPLESAKMEIFGRQQVDLWHEKIRAAGIEPQ